MKYFLTLVVCMGVFAGAAEAGLLTVAKEKGLVCELTTGFLAPQGEASPETLLLVKEKNEKRRLAYADIARKQGGGVTPEDIGVTSAVVILSEGKKGMFFQNAAGVCVPLP